MDADGAGYSHFTMNGKTLIAKITASADWDLTSDTVKEDAPTFYRLAVRFRLAARGWYYLHPRIMKKVTFVVIFASIFASAISNGFAAEQTADYAKLTEAARLRNQTALAIADGPFQPSWDSLAQYQWPEWFRDAKFGIWAHWTAQSVPEQGDWYARKMYLQRQPGL